MGRRKRPPIGQSGFGFGEETIKRADDGGAGDTRSTSAIAYSQIKAEGLLGKMQTRVYGLLYHHGPLTGHELNAKGESPDLHKRLSELARKGTIARAGKRKCKATGRLAWAWHVTGNLPSRED